MKIQIRSYRECPDLGQWTEEGSAEVIDGAGGVIIIVGEDCKLAVDRKELMAALRAISDGGSK